MGGAAVTRYKKQEKAMNHREVFISHYPEALYKRVALRIFAGQTTRCHCNGHCSNQCCHCFSVQSALEAKVTAATVKWVGEGSWTLDNLCFDWDHEAYQVWTCTVLYCTVVYCTVLYCTVLYCSVLYYTVLFYNIHYCTLYCSYL